jgi:G3E family GTPase
MRVHVLGGFLGSGKTSLVRALAQHARDRGDRVVVVTNDHGRVLVDSSSLGAAEIGVREVAQGRLCCRYDDLDAALVAAADAGATVAIAEAVGTCADLLSTVVAPLASLRAGRFDVAPLAVAVDPRRSFAVATGRIHDEIAYLYRKQIEEADVLLLTHADDAAADVAPDLATMNPGAPVVRVSGPAGTGLDAWLDAKVRTRRATLSLDYDRWAAAEAAIGWFNARVRVWADEPFVPAELAERFLVALAWLPVAHLKIASLDPAGGTASMVCRRDEPRVDFPDGPPVRVASWVVNARATVPPEELQGALQSALGAAARRASVEWSDVQAFRPSPAQPKHRADAVRA